MPALMSSVTFSVGLLVVGGCLVLLPASTEAWIGTMYRNRERQALADYEDDTPAFRPQAPVARTGMWYQQRRSGGNLPEDDFPMIGIASGADQQQPQLSAIPSGSCHGMACRTDEGCCEAMVCKTPEPESKKAPVLLGTCVPNPNEGSPCKQDAGCGVALDCVMTAGSRGFKTCQPKHRDVSRKQYNDDCRVSMECDQSRGLCCQAQRRHRQAPRKICSYFKDLHNCIGFRKDYMPDSMDAITSLKNKWWQYR